MANSLMNHVGGDGRVYTLRQKPTVSYAFPPVEHTTASAGITRPAPQRAPVMTVTGQLPNGIAAAAPQTAVLFPTPQYQSFQQQFNQLGQQVPISTSAFSSPESQSGFFPSQPDIRPKQFQTRLSRQMQAAQMIRQQNVWMKDSKAFVPPTTTPYIDTD